MRSRVWVAAGSGLLGLLLAGCGTGQDAPTAATLSSIPGVSADDGGVGVRNARVPFDPAGYPAGGDAPIRLSIVNHGTEPVQLVDLSSPSAGSVTVREVVRVGPAAPPGDPGGPPDGGAGPQLLLAPDELVDATLQVSGLAEELDGTVPLPVMLTFDNGASFALQVPTAPPAGPLPREPAAPAEDHET